MFFFPDFLYFLSVVSLTFEHIGDSCFKIFIYYSDACISSEMVSGDSFCFFEWDIIFFSFFALPNLLKIGHLKNQLLLSIFTDWHERLLLINMLYLFAYNILLPFVHKSVTLQFSHSMIHITVFHNLCSLKSKLCCYSLSDLQIR